MIVLSKKFLLMATICFLAFTLNLVHDYMLTLYYLQITLYTGCSLKQLDLDSCTLSEILRLHILASGAECNYTNAKFRYQKQGGFGSTDDPCVELRLSAPSLLKKLSCTAVYDLLPGMCTPSRQSLWVSFLIKIYTLCS